MTNSDEVGYNEENDVSFCTRCGITLVNGKHTCRNPDNPVQGVLLGNYPAGAYSDEISVMPGGGLEGTGLDNDEPA